MKLGLALPVLGLLLCTADTMAEAEIEVAISKTKVTLTCPLEPGVKWKKGERQISENPVYEIENYDSSEHDGNYICEPTVGKNSLRLHLKAKVCQNCEELDVLTVAGVILADLFITLGVLILVYYFSKNRKGRVGGSAGVHPRGQKMVRPPPVPNPDYEPIRKGQREVYAGLQSRGF